jgi:hypothetical protein
MYCPNCGAESTSGLNYCKRCGGNLSEQTQAAWAPNKNVLAALILAVATASIVLGGLAIIFTFTLGLIGPQAPGLSPPLNNALPVAGMMVVFGSATIALVTLMLMRLFSRVMGFDSSVAKTIRSQRTLPTDQPYLSIPAPPVGVQSVTEHTTRNFEPRPRQQDTRE